MSTDMLFYATNRALAHAILDGYRIMSTQKAVTSEAVSAMEV